MRKDIRITSDTQNLRIVEKAIDDLSIELDLTDEIYGNVLVAIMEAANNAIVHGNKNDPNKEVIINIIMVILNITETIEIIFLFIMETYPPNAQGSAVWPAEQE